MKTYRVTATIEHAMEHTFTADSLEEAKTKARDYLNINNFTPIQDDENPQTFIDWQSVQEVQTND